MVCNENLKLFELIEGKYAYERGNKSFHLALYGPNNSKAYDYGDHFSFTRTEKGDGLSGMSETFFGKYRIEGAKLILECRDLESESWDEEEEAEGEAFNEPYDGGPIEGEIIKEPQLVLILSFWEDEGLKLKKK